MTININNQSPAEIYHPLDILPLIDVDLPIDEYLNKQKEYIKEELVEPLFQPLNANQPVTIEDVTDPNDIKNIDRDAIVNGLNHIWSQDVVDVSLEKQLTDVFYRSLMYSHPSDWRIEEHLALENMAKLQLPLPSNGQNGILVRYTPRTDIIPVAKQLLSNPSDTDLISQWFGSITGYTHDILTDTMLITVQHTGVWDSIKESINQLRQSYNHGGHLNSDTNTLLSNIDKIDLTNELSTGIFLPEQGQGSQLEEYSFTRILMFALGLHEQNNADELFVQPINMKEIINPSKIIILNLEEYSHATNQEIIKDWDELRQAFTIQKRLDIVSLKKLMTAEKVNASMNPNASHDKKRNNPAIKRTQRPFGGKPITKEQTLRLMASVINQARTKKQTENSFKSHKKSYMRPNRRDPNNVNLMGKLTTEFYRPDIHVYIDTSGSISESQYRDAVGSLILLTKKINANLYVSSFSHVISGTSLLKTKDKSLSQIYKQFLNIPKVGGGTDFENVWNKIDQLDILNQKSGKSYQINFIITDFGYSLQRDRRFHREQPSHKYTYYVPISSDVQVWSQITNMAKRFSKEMAHAGAKGIRKHMLM